MLIVAGISIPVLARAQADEHAPLTISVHPSVATIVRLPDEIVHTWIVHGGEIRVGSAGDTLYVRPRPGTPAGVEASLDVQTKTVRRTFLLRVVGRARDARREVVVPAAGAPFAMPTTLMAPPTAVIPVAEEPVASVATAAPSPTPAEPAAQQGTAVDIARAATAPRSPRFDLAVHSVVGTGLTGLVLAGLRPQTAVQPHHLVGLHLTGEPWDTWWSLEANVSGEQTAGSLRYVKRGTASELEVSGPRLRMEVGMRASHGKKWKASAHVRLGMQVHLRRIQERTGEIQSSETLERGGILALGVGLRYQARRRILLGVDFQVRQGWPDDDYSVAALLSVGRFLDQGD